jgi:hypothetical protein
MKKREITIKGVTGIEAGCILEALYACDFNDGDTCRVKLDDGTETVWVFSSTEEE